MRHNRAGLVGLLQTARHSGQNQVVKAVRSPLYKHSRPVMFEHHYSVKQGRRNHPRAAQAELKFGEVGQRAEPAPKGWPGFCASRQASSSSFVIRRANHCKAAQR